MTAAPAMSVPTPHADGAGAGAHARYARQLRDDAAAWDEFVAGAPTGAYPQLSAWAQVKIPNGWRAQRVLAVAPSGPIGAQLLMRRLGPGPFSVGYAPRGPIAREFEAEGVRAFSRAMRRAAARHQLSHVTIDPEVEEGHPLGDLLRANGWRQGANVQPERTLVVDLDRAEEEIWAGLRSKWRQYVGKARRSGVAVVESDASGLGEFYRIYVETAQRAGFLYRTEAAYRDVYEAFAARGAARLLFARLADGTAAATLMLLECGGRVVEPYGGMTAGGADLRANYLLKWEAIRSSREAGLAVYDMWGLAHSGIEHFKRGFGGREVRYVGAWELVRLPPVRTALLTAHRLRLAVARRSLGAARSDDDGGGGAGA